MFDEFEPLIADRIFKYVYGTEKNKQVLMNLLSSCPFLKNYSLQSLTIQKQSLLETMSSKEKDCYADIVVFLRDAIIDIEAYRELKKDDIYVSKEYLTRLYSSQISSSKNVLKHLPVIQLLFVKKISKNLLKEKEFINHYHIVNKNGNCFYKDDLQTFIILIDKADSQSYNDDEKMNDFLTHLRLMNASSLEEVKCIGKESEIGMDIEKIMEAYANDTVFHEAIAEIRKAKMEKEAKLRGRREGRKEGRIEGRNEIQKETAKKMLEDHMSCEAISKYSGLSLNEVKSLQRSLQI